MKAVRKTETRNIKQTASPPDYYSILSVPHKATREEIVKAFEKKVLKGHPYANSNTSEQDFQLVQAAYDTLSNDENRRLYDSYMQTLNKLKEKKMPRQKSNKFQRFLFAIDPAFEKNIYKKLNKNWLCMLIISFCIGIYAAIKYSAAYSASKVVWITVYVTLTLAIVLVVSLFISAIIRLFYHHQFVNIFYKTSGICFIIVTIIMLNSIP